MEVKAFMQGNKSWSKLARTILPLLLVLLVIGGFVSNARYWNKQVPIVVKGVLDLGGWDVERTFEIKGQWELYWDRLLNLKEIAEGTQTCLVVEAPDAWSSYELNGIRLPGKGKATYRIHVIGAETGKCYGVRIQGMFTSYELYMDDTLIVKNGSFSDDASAPASGYRPQLAGFVPKSDSFDLIMQMSNDIHGVGGMKEAVIFGSYERVLAFDRLISVLGAYATSGIVFTCLFFMIFFALQRDEKDIIILAGISMIILIKFMIIGDVMLTVILPRLSVGSVLRLDFLSTVWTQFLLIYFVYYAYADIVPGWQVKTILAYCTIATLYILLIPLDIAASIYPAVNLILLLVLSVVTMHLYRASVEGYEGASLMLGSIMLILLLVLYEIFLSDRSQAYYLIKNLHFDYMLFGLAQVVVLALRYRRGQRLEIAHLKGQMRPHFIHNALTSIISISRTEPDRARELLLEFSSYLRGFYDYEKDELITFTQELELIKAYAILEQARFGDRLRLECSIDVENFFLPPLVLQPLVENAFVHGLCQKDEGGTVVVYTRLVKNKKVRIGVRDDGVGFSTRHNASRQGVGIENTGRRLYKLYRTSLVYHIPEGGGCEVYFEIPYKEAVEYEGMVD